MIGDVHGRADLLDRMLARISDADPQARARCILVGDLVDRGPDSAGVLETVRGLCLEQPERWVCLTGNHERMLLSFLDDPPGYGPHWLANGGDATLRSFGLTPRHGQGSAALTGLARDLAAALGPGMIAWLRGLPLIWHEGGLVVAHAGIDPGRPLAEQDEDTLLWGRRPGRRGKERQPSDPEAGRFWVVQGHVVHEQPLMRGRSIHVDSGAWASGRLTAAWLQAGQHRPHWLSVQGEAG